jgi:hypothetical protein
MRINGFLIFYSLDLVVCNRGRILVFERFERTMHEISKFRQACGNLISCFN